jgi:two-component system chemotaxis sensor kinase CheA
MRGFLLSYARYARELARSLQRELEVELEGEETRLDRRIARELEEALVHLIRNAVDHGIEPPAAREALGKPRAGRIRISAVADGPRVRLVIADDGAGIDVQRVVQQAVDVGLVEPGSAAATGKREALRLLFAPGFSTRKQVSEISGRGVGLDVVRKNVGDVNGSIKVESAPGRGARFIIRLPLTLAIVDGLVLRVGSERFVIPTFAVRESLRPLPDQVHALQGRPRMVRVREKLIPLLHLGSAFGVNGACERIVESTVVIIEDADRTLALVVDELLGKYEVVIKSLGDAFGNIRGVAGGAILGDGRIGLILDAGGLLALSAGMTDAVGTAA